MRRALPAIAGLTALAAPIANAVAVARTPVASLKAKIVTRTVSGSEAEASRWGYVKVNLVIRKTTRTLATGKKKVTRKIVRVTVPEYPNHTDRSVYINQQALPYLVEEVMQAQLNPNIQLVGGATDTSYAFQQSLQAAILKAKQV